MKYNIWTQIISDLLVNRDVPHGEKNQVEIITVTR